MLKFSNIQPVVLMYCSSSFQMLIRTRTKDVETMTIIRKRVEDRKFFGPLLEKSRKRKKIPKHSKNNQTTSADILDKIDKNNVTSDNNDNLESSELQWVTKTSNQKNLQVVKNNGNDNQFLLDDQSTLKPFTTINEVSNVLKLDSKIFDDIIAEETDNQVSQNSINNNNNNNDDSVNVSDFSLKPNDRLNIPIKSNLDYQSKKFPLINTVKSDQDQWKESQKISQVTIEGKDFALPGVTRILNATMSDEARKALDKWKERMISSLGEEGFEKYMKDQQESSKLMHSLISDKLQNEPVEIPDNLQNTFRSINLILKNIKNVRLLESHVIHSDLRYRGIVDCVASYRENVCLIDWKKSDKIKTLNTTYDLPLQLSAYVGALNSDPNYPFKVKTAVLAVAYSNGQPPSIFEYPESKLKFYWKEWLKRIEKYYLIKSSGNL